MRKRLPLTSAPDRLEPEARDRIRAWAQSHAPRAALHLGRHWAECRDHHRMRGNQYADWEAAFRTWLRRAVLIEEEGWEAAWGRLRPRSRVLGPSGASRGSSADLSSLRDELAEVIPLFQDSRLTRGDGSR